LKREDFIDWTLGIIIESFNDFIKLFPNSIILMHQWKKAIEHNVKDGLGNLANPFSKKLIQTKSERKLLICGK
jgi:hypothetical protein